MPHAAATVRLLPSCTLISFNILGDKHKKKNPRNCSSSVAKQTLTSAQKSSQNSNTQYIRG